MRAVTALGAIDAGDSIGVLVLALNDPSRVVRTSAAESLGRLGAREATGDLARLLSTAGDEWTRLYAAEALSALGDPSVAGAAADALAGTPRWARERRRRWQRLVLAAREPSR